MAELVTSRLPAPANQPMLAVEPSLTRDGWNVCARDLGPDLNGSLGVRLASLLRVRVADPAFSDNEDLPDVSGDHKVLGDGLHFVPHFPFEPGVRFRAILDLSALGRPGLAGVLTYEFSFPIETAAMEAEVTQVYPSNDVLPENLLRFYVCFSNPMRRGRAQANIEILGPDGKPAPDVFYRAPVELWDRSMTCLTVLLDPGRLKRGVGPNRILGPPLKASQRYTLAVGPDMIDVYGRPLREGFSKSFTVSEADRAPIDITAWKIRPPTVDSHEPLEVVFPTALDWAQLWHGITVASADREQMSGRIEVDRGETRWHFTPDVPWRVGAHSVHVSPDLEDACGNTPYAPFDGPLRSANELDVEKAVRSVLFVVERSEGRSGKLNCRNLAFHIREGHFRFCRLFRSRSLE
jgi:hypothetical protein